MCLSRHWAMHLPRGVGATIIWRGGPGSICRCTRPVFSRASTRLRVAG